MMIAHKSRSHKTRAPRKGNPTGFTLLEVLLALAISTMIIGALFMAIDVQLGIADTSRIQVEEAQLAHAILHRIADDLRNAVRYEAQDITSAYSAVAGSSGLASSFSTGSGSGGGDGTEDGGGSTQPPGGTEDDTSLTEEAVTIPGIYGNTAVIQIDFSRVPRVDEYMSLVEDRGNGAAPLEDLVSDVKSSTYYVIGADPDNYLSRMNRQGPVDDDQSGLYYRSIDRAATEFASYNGQQAELDEQGIILSERVTRLEFEYYDGTEWVLEWDSTDRQGIPVAVKILLELYPMDWELMSEQEQQQLELPIYQTVVWLPTAEPTTAGALSSSLSSSTDSSSSSTSSSGASSSSSSGASGASGAGSTGSGTSGSGSAGSAGAGGAGGAGGGGAGGGQNDDGGTP